MIRKIFPWFDFDGILSGEKTDDPYKAFNSKDIYKFWNDADIKPKIFTSADGKRYPYYLLYKSKNKNRPWKIIYGSYSGKIFPTTWDNVPVGCSQHWKNDFGHDECKICNIIFLSDDKTEITRMARMLNSKRNESKSVDDIFDEFNEYTKKLISKYLNKKYFDTVIYGILCRQFNGDFNAYQNELYLNNGDITNNVDIIKCIDEKFRQLQIENRYASNDIGRYTLNDIMHYIRNIVNNASANNLNKSTIARKWCKAVNWDKLTSLEYNGWSINEWKNADNDERESVVYTVDMSIWDYMRIFDISELFDIYYKRI